VGPVKEGAVPELFRKERGVEESTRPKRRFSQSHQDKTTQEKLISLKRLQGEAKEKNKPHEFASQKGLRHFPDITSKKDHLIRQGSGGQGSAIENLRGRITRTRSGRKEAEFLKT